MKGDVRMMENKQLNEKKIALYIRLSRDDGDRAESLSITNQRLLLTEFVKVIYFWGFRQAAYIPTDLVS